MNKRFCKLGTYAARAFFLFALCGAGASCSDDYKWDNEDPQWLGSSIYDYLNTQGNYKNFVRLIEDLDYKEVLQRTGSKTLFVADDDAFSTFYQSNPWGVKSYDQLSLSQKKLLLNSAMINNAYLLEMMSSTPAGGGDNDQPQKGQCLRRETAYDITDSVPRFSADELPMSLNKTDKDYWARFRDPQKGGIVLALDATTPMMTHFLPAHMQANNITSEDFQILTGQARSENDAFIYDSKVIGQDITCQNGYVNKLDKVLVPPQNMAEVLRTNENTKIFSHMLDRFSAPFYSENLTRRYQLLYGNAVDSVYQKRYFSKRSQGTTALTSDRGTDPNGNPTGNTVKYALNFDPGWNSYQSDTRAAKETDMGVIFAPTDEKLLNYFFAPDGGGRFLIEAYAPEYKDMNIADTPADVALAFYAIDQIPLDVIQALINNLMKDSFVGSVPSKFETIKNDAQDPMLDETHLKYIKGVKMANNGIIYLMDEVITPAQYASVSAPAYVATDMRIFNWAVQQAQLGGINSNYSAYLLAMSSRFSFFVPQDDFWYVDPLSFYNPEIENGIIQARAFHYTWDEKKNTPAVASHIAQYDIATGTLTIDKTEGGVLSKETVSNTVYGNRLKDMLECHTIIHEDNSELTGINETETGAECSQRYFVTKNGTAIAINNATKRANGMTVQGGWQVDNDEECGVIRFDDKSRQTNGNGNGFAYELNAPIQPTIESVYSAMYKNPEFSKFFELCLGDDQVLSEIGLKGTEARKYTIFVNNNGIPCYGQNANGAYTQISKATNVRFFNNYRYTVYVPTNKAMEEAEAKGLPTWQDLREILELDVEYEERTELTPEQHEARNAKVLAMATSIINFVKNHFVDNSVFADAATYAPTPYETATIADSETGIYSKVTVQSNGNGQLSVKDATGKTSSITSNNNIIVRDYITAGKSDAYQNTLTSSSAAVLHGLDGVLDYKTYDGGRYDSDWSTVAKARAYVKKYPSVK